MQQGLFSSPPHDADGLVSRINSLAARMRAKRVPVIFIQHCGPEGDDLHPSQPGHALHNDLAVGASDLIIAKASCDAFLDTTLGSLLAELEVNELIITGFATDVCVDTTVRSALGSGYGIILQAAGNNHSDRTYFQRYH